MKDISRETPLEKKSQNKKNIALGAGIGMIFGAALGNAGVGLVLGAGIGMILGRKGIKLD